MSRKHQGQEGPTLDIAAEKSGGAGGGDQRLASPEKKKTLMRQSAVAPRAEPSTHGANQWTGGRRNKRKAH